VYSWPRFIADDMRFGVLDSGHGANHDGFMADVVRSRQWKVRGGGCAVGGTISSLPDITLFCTGLLEAVS
jgi:hypothetical protein